MKNYINFAGTDSTEFNIGISGSGTFDAPERDVTQISVPGRSGDLLLDNNRFKNITLTYPAFISKDFSKNFDAFKAFMLSNVGYQVLEDTYHPDIFRMAEFRGPLNPDVKVLNIAGEFDLIFNCKPQRWLKEGQKGITFTEAATIINPCLFSSKPLVRVYGTGELAIGSNTIEITSVDEYVDIDCELQDAFKGTTNCNSDIELTSGSFFELSPGENGISFDDSITSIVITPRWWTI